MTPAAADRAPDRSKSEAVQAIRASAARLSPAALRRLREELIRRELGLIEELIEAGVDPARVSALAHCRSALEAVELFAGNLRARA